MPATTILPSPWTATAFAPLPLPESPNLVNTTPSWVGPKLVSRVPSTLKRATANLELGPKLFPVLPTTTVLPSACTATSLTEKGTVALPSRLKDGSRVPAAKSRRSSRLSNMQRVRVDGFPGVTASANFLDQRMMSSFGSTSSSCFVSLRPTPAVGSQPRIRARPGLTETGHAPGAVAGSPSRYHWWCRLRGCCAGRKTSTHRGPAEVVDCEVAADRGEDDSQA